MGKHVPLFKEKSQTNEVTKFDKKESRRAFGMDIDTKEVTAPPEDMFHWKVVTGEPFPKPLKDDN